MRLENWWFVDDSGIIFAMGTVYGSSRHTDGSLIMSSEILSVEETDTLRINTKSGTSYDLVSPDWDGHSNLIKTCSKKLGIHIKRR